MTEMLKEILSAKIYVCGYCDKVINENKITKHLKTIHNIERPQVSEIITKVIML